MEQITLKKLRDTMDFGLHTDGEYEVYIGKMYLCKVDSKEIAERLQACCNEHDTLKAQAELLNEFVKYCEEEDDSPIDKCNLAICRKIDELIDKTKELK